MDALLAQPLQTQGAGVVAICQLGNAGAAPSACQVAAARALRCTVLYPAPSSPEPTGLGPLEAQQAHQVRRIHMPGLQQRSAGAASAGCLTGYGLLAVCHGRAP